MQKRVRRSREEHWRRMMMLWIISLFFLMVAVVVIVVYAYNIKHPENKALSAIVDYSKIHFEGLAIGEKVPTEAMAQPVTDAAYNYVWNNISIKTDDNDTITRLAFYTVNAGEENSVKLSDVSIDYRDYPLSTISDYVMYFGYAKISHFRDYKYLDYEHEGYRLHLEILKNELYNVELYKN